MTHVGAARSRVPSRLALTDARKTLAQLNKLLFTRDPEVTAQGVELLRSLGDPALFDALLAGVTCSCPTSTDPTRPLWGTFTVGGPCGNAPTTGRFDLMVALALLGAAPPESAALIRSAAAFIRFSASAARVFSSA